MPKRSFLPKSSALSKCCIKLLPIESLLQYRFATPKTLKSRPRPNRCRTAPLYKSSSLFVVVFFRFWFR